MDSRSKLILGIMTTTLAAFGAGCSDDGADGGSVSTGGGGSSASSSTTSTATGGSSSSSSSSSQSSGGSSSSSSVSSSAGASTVGGSTSTGGKSTSSAAAGSSSASSSSAAAGSSGGSSTTTTSSASGGTGGRTGGRATTGGTSSGGTSAGGSSSSATTPVSTGPITFPEKFVGNIDTYGKIRDDFSKYWDQFSPENAGKWGSVQGSNQNSFNWNSLDTMYKYANDNKIIFKQHTFVWGAQQPGWVNDSNAEAAVKNWMTTFCQRYPNTKIIDVVNEPPPHTTPKYKNGIGGDGSSGWDWIANAFKWARAACPNAVLVLNDYNNVELSGDAKHTSDIANAIKKAGAPIDAIGCQTHGASNAPSSTLKNNIDTIVKNTGLPVYITEYDIAQADDQKQLTQYKDHITMFMNHANIKGVTLWGYLVGATWVANTGILKSDGTMRPAMTWLMDFLKRN